MRPTRDGGGPDNGQLRLPFGPTRRRSPQEGGGPPARPERPAPPAVPSAAAAPGAAGATAGTPAEPAGVLFVRHRRARRYVIRVSADGAARVTIPRGGSRRDAEAFLRRSTEWLERQRRERELQRHREESRWTVGGAVLVRGVRCVLAPDDGAADRVRLGSEVVTTRAGESVRDAVRRHLRLVAARELPARVHALAAPLGVAVTAVSVRDQRTRWGSCSTGGAISLNWRLVQMPAGVADYVIYHELAHLAVANHSPRFWRLVARWCPWTDAARAWLRRHGGELA